MHGRSVCRAREAYINHLVDVARTLLGQGGTADNVGRGPVLDTTEHSQIRLPDGIVTLLLVAGVESGTGLEPLVDRVVAAYGGVRFRVHGEERRAGAFA